MMTLNEINLTQEAYVSDDNMHYEAYGLDRDGNGYMVQWDILEGTEEVTDESECCNWNEYKVITL